MIDYTQVRNAFGEVYGDSQREPRLFRAPGRVNLIGEHTDYNDGYVLPMAIDRETVVAALPRADRLVRVHSLNVNESANFDLDHPGPTQRGHWLDYVEGVAHFLDAPDAKRLRGANMLLLSDVPEGSGLSSSAALEIATGFALLSIASTEKINRVQLALAGQQAEHQYVGSKTGIMDQFIAALGQAGHALLIDCRSLEAVPVPIDLSDSAIVICNSEVKHALAGSEYNTRRTECERGVEVLREVLPDIRALRDVSPNDFEKYAARLPEPVRQRCRHVVMENRRTLLAVEALRAGDLTEMGRLMYESHRSLQHDYEVSCFELDTLVDIAKSTDGVFGARMTGGGFGGCTVNLVRQEALKNFQETVVREYYAATQITPAIYVARASAGAEEI